MNKSTQRAQAAIAKELTRLRHENSQLRNAHDDLVAALELIHANAAESPEWIRARIETALAKAKGDSQ